MISVAMMIKITFISLAVILGFAAKNVFKKPDSFIEQEMERHIKEELDIVVDFSPEE